MSTHEAASRLDALAATTGDLQEYQHSGNLTLACGRVGCRVGQSAQID